MKPLLFFAFLLLSSFCFAQQEIRINKISKGDSLALFKSIGILIEAIENKDSKVIKASCLEIVYCEKCTGKLQTSHTPIEDGFVPVSDFIPYLVDSLRTSPAWISIKQYSPGVLSISSKGIYHPKSVKLKPDEYFTEFELSYNIESSFNKYIFSFVKEEGKYKLWGVKFSTD